jgi:hypothetical protein
MNGMAIIDRIKVVGIMSKESRKSGVLVKNIVTVIAILIINSVISAAGIRNEFSIAKFKTTERDFSQKNSDIIVNSAGSQLKEIDSIKAIESGGLVLRKKFEPGEYRLFKGRIDTAAFSREPPIYSFAIPAEFSADQFIVFRLYQMPSKNQSEDLEEVFFDNHNFYVRYFSKVFYNNNGTWFTLEGKRKYPTGNLSVSSTPPGAQIVLNGVPSGRLTPSDLKNVPGGNYAIELFLPNHHFTRKNIRVVADSTVRHSFELMSDFDTITITGTSVHGLLMLPQPPVATNFILDSLSISELILNVESGAHRLRWNGGNEYKSIDTVVIIKPGKVTYFSSPFHRRSGNLKIIPVPKTAEVCIEHLPCSGGEKQFDLPSGMYKVSVEKYGYQKILRDIEVFPDTQITIIIDLQSNSDRDSDGFLDSSDRCPDVYGLYDGCPKRMLKYALSDKMEEVGEYARNDKFRVGFTLFGIISKIPTRKQFANFLSTFSSGKIGGVNNYRGLTFANSVHVMYRGFYSALEFGQWTAGLQYQRPDTMLINTAKNKYLVYYDSVRGVKPVLYLPSTSFCLGFHYNWSFVNIVYGLGYQWEDIVITRLSPVNNVSAEEEMFTEVSFDNDWWFHQLNFETDFIGDDFFVPSVYFKFKFPFGSSNWTRWMVFQAGLQMKLGPFLKENRRK